MKETDGLVLFLQANSRQSFCDREFRTRKPTTRKISAVGRWRMMATQYIMSQECLDTTQDSALPEEAGQASGVSGPEPRRAQKIFAFFLVPIS
ncbi:hypothetical protein PoB_006518100 [Plakobranchus ocellatus]|uniref:Uncharacterized protein n=1 Tax=Plakobranchus ocellatus TaxID=259542 RepID=A0AAV4D3M0_9GAST|nr:hypothetical protein PoB_006518100 [Plakobranchus ocellatus]